MNEKVNVYIEYRISRAEESLQEAEILAASGHWNTCVNRLYYSCFYSVSALLLKHGLSSSKHSGVRSIFNNNFVKTGILSKETAQIYNFLFERRQEGDYEDMAIFTESEVVPWVDKAKAFVDTVKVLIDRS